MKDTRSAVTSVIGDTGGGNSSDGGGGGTASSSSSPEMSTLSSPASISSAATSAIANVAPFTSFHGATVGISPLLCHNQVFTSEMIRQSTAFMAATGLPVGLQSSLTSGSNIFPTHGGIFSWPQTSSPPPANSVVTTNSTNNNRMATKAIVPRKNNNVVSSSVAVTRKNQANARKRTTRKTDLAEQTIIEVAAMKHIPSAAPLSPPTSGSSPPTDVLGSGKGTTVNPEKEVVASRDKVFTCRICNRSFGYKHVLQNHERTHTGEKPFKCSVCQKRFTRDHHLKTHMRLHTGEKPYLCSHCDRQFVQVANLRRHLRVHTGERPYACTDCSSKFSDSNQLKAHNLIHKGEKPFECDKCQNKFRRRHHLMHHKCPGNNGTSGIIINNFKDDSNGREQKSPESYERMEDAVKNNCGVYQNMLQNFSTVKDEVGDIYGQDVGALRRGIRIAQPLLMGDVGRNTKLEDIEDDEEALDVVVEEEDDEDIEEREDLITSHRNGLILAHNNNGSVLERKNRVRKPQEIRHVIRPVITSPVSMPPEQTEPEDLSMSTGQHNGYRNNHVHSNSHSSGDSPLSRSPSSGPDEEDDDLVHKLPPSKRFVHSKYQQHLQRNNGRAPVS